MTLLATVAERAAEIADQFGIDIEEALARWEQAGSTEGGDDAGAWLSVAFLFSRQNRSEFSFGQGISDALCTQTELLGDHSDCRALRAACQHPFATLG